MTKTLALFLTAAFAACGRGEAEVHYSGDSNTPELVALESDPSVMVVANADEPIFYSENTYFLYRNDHWYRSSSHRGGWARVDTPPEHVSRIEQPRAYVHYRHNADASRTTFNQSQQNNPPPAPPDQVAPPSPNDTEHPTTPSREPNPQNPSQQPYANPPPPNQVPPSPDSSPTLQSPRDPRNPQVPPVTPDRNDRPSGQIAPDPDRAPTSPGMTNRAPDQRPAARDDSDKRPDEKTPDKK